MEIKTFKTNVTPEAEMSDEDCLVKMICVGDFTGGGEPKGKFILDYLAYEPYSKEVKWHRGESEHELLNKLNILEGPEYERFIWSYMDDKDFI